MQNFRDESSGGARIYNLGAKPERRRREDRGAEGAETETPKALRGGKCDYKGSARLGERHKPPPQRGPGQSSGRKRF